MKKIVLIMSIMCISLLSAASLERFQDTGDGINVRFENLRTSPFERAEGDLDEWGEPALDSPVISRTLALPFASAQLSVNQMSWRVFSKDGVYQYTRAEINDGVVQLCEPFTFREMRGYTVRINTQIENEDEILTLNNLDFDLQGNGVITLPQTVSPAFIDSYKALADNWDGCYLNGLSVGRPSMLIISHPNLANYLGGFIHWKRSLGFDVHVINREDAGSSIGEIRETIRQHYQEHNSDYLLLLGDTVGNFSIPTNFYPSPEYNENDADDQYYTLLEGDDYFPEMLVGRFSFGNIMEFMNMAAKTISYEREPFMGDTAWMSRALAIAGNYAEGNLHPSTPILMSRWYRDRMLDFGYAEVDTVFFPPSFPGTSSITQSINRGVQFISYRGWGDANGWHYPSFHIPDLVNISNGPKMPIIYSIVCNTGDFANVVNPCFGEAWMRMGTTAVPGGAVGFVGPSDLHTKTRFNNTIASGAYRSILDYDVRGFGSSVMMGKVELYKNYPNDREIGQYVPFYFHVYNILSDPSLNMWVLEPGVINENIIQGGLTFAQSDSYIRINAPHLEGGIVSGTKDDENFTYGRIVDGVGILNIDPEEEGNLTLTVSKENWVPLVRTLNVEGAAGIGVIENSGADQTINPSQSMQIEITLKNYSEDAMNFVTGSIQEHEHLEITALNPDSFDLASGAMHTLNFELQANHLVHPGDVLNLSFMTENPASEHIFQMNGGGARIAVWDYAGDLPLEETSTLTFSALNNGNAALQGAQVLVQSMTDAATISSAVASLGDIAAGAEFSFDADISLMPDVWNGRQIGLRFIFTGEDGYEWMSFYSVTAGFPSTSDPTGPDEYGYYAFDDTDLGYDMAPVYDWVELDPELGGSGNLWLVMDDDTLEVPLPFSFRFYGQDYESLTISSNGWVSFIHTDESYFNNHYIPGALGPQAMIAGYWDDLKGMKIGVTPQGEDIFADMRILYWHDVANDRFIVQYNEAYSQYTIQAGEDASLEKFQIILYPKDNDDGDIVVQYHTVDNPATTGNYCTVGLEDHNQLSGLTYTHANVYPPTAAELQPGRAICFTTTPIDDYVGVDDPVAMVPVSNLRNYPNPFNPTTTISFDSKSATVGNLKIYNTRGQSVRKLHDGVITAGNNSLIWDGTDDAGASVASGIYLYRLKTPGASYIRRMLMMK